MLRLIAERRFNFVNAGWCQNDEASVHVDGIIDQHTLGHLFLRRLIGDVYVYNRDLVCSQCSASGTSVRCRGTSVRWPRHGRNPQGWTPHLSSVAPGAGRRASVPLSLSC